MITVWNVKKSEVAGVNETPVILAELKGLSGDTKPSVIKNGAIENGSTFLEIDTGDLYSYDGDNKEWIITSEGNLTSEEPSEPSEPSEPDEPPAEEPPVENQGESR